MYFLLFVVVVSALGTAIVLVRNRRPTTMASSIDEFRRSLDAIAPEDAARAADGGRPQPDGGADPG